MKNMKVRGSAVLAGCLLSCLMWRLVNAANAEVVVAAAAKSGEVQAAAAKPTVLAPEVPASQAPAGSYRYSLSLKQLGQAYPLQLRGVDSSNGAPFNIRDDEVVTAAKLRLRYGYSPALISDLSHINVLVNDELAATVPVPKETAGRSLETVVDLPVWLIGSFNRLRLQLIGHYTMQCEDPTHSSLWADISNQSSLELTVTPVAQANDLGLLPQPFFDRRDVRALHLPFVFAGAPDNVTLAAAGMVASWFGALADYRGASFPVDTSGKLPGQGAAVMFVIGASAPATVGSRALAGPTLAVVSNPSDNNGKLLLVMGRSPEELKVAARALTLGSQTLNGQSATISAADQLRPRQPYDAPRWLRSDRPVKFGELADAKVFSVAGYTPDQVRVDVRVPPDLFAWQDQGIPVHLKYRYTPRPTHDKSTLTIGVDRQYIGSYPLLSQSELKRTGVLAKVLGDGSVPAEADLRIPAYRFGADSQLQYQFNYDYLKQGECRDVIIDNAHSAIDPDSTINISGYDHYLAMPDLAAFAGMGFPFTRMADLSETTVVMPDAADLADLSGYLTLMAQMGRSTGYPVVGVTIANAKDTSALQGRDLLVIDAAGRQPLAKAWAFAMPAAGSGGERGFMLSDLPQRIRGWFSSDPRENAAADVAHVSFSSDGASGAFMGFESPISPGRSVVLVSSGSDAAWAQVLAALGHQEGKVQGQVRGSLAVVHGNVVSSLESTQSYYVGHLSPFKHLRWYLSSRPLLLLALCMVAIVLLALLVYSLLQAQARRRLAVGR